MLYELLKPGFEFMPQVTMGSLHVEESYCQILFFKFLSCISQTNNTYTPAIYFKEYLATKILKSFY